MDQAKYDLETAEIKRLEAISTKTKEECLILDTQIRDAYWRRRMATRTEEEIAKNICAP